MLQSFITRIVAWCIHRRLLVVLIASLIAAACGLYTACDFAIDTNVDDLLSSQLPWRQRELAYRAAFPQQGDIILAVVEAPTPKSTGAAADALVRELTGKSDIFRSVQEEGGGSFYRRNAFLFLPTNEVARTAQELSNARPGRRPRPRGPEQPSSPAGGTALGLIGLQMAAGLTHLASSSKGAGYASSTSSGEARDGQAVRCRGPETNDKF